MSNYPGEIDDNGSLPSVADNSTEISGEHLNNIRDAVLAVQATLGVDPQGTLNTVGERLAVSLNPNGTIKASAISGAFSPITNSDVDANAGIVESKLSLNVPTQTLRTDIDSNDVDISNLQSLTTNLNNRYANHIGGVAERHDGYQIDVDALEGVPSVTTTGAAVHYNRNTFREHVGASSGSHTATQITFDDSFSSDITGANVQAAVESSVGYTDSSFSSHVDLVHGEGMTNKYYNPENKKNRDSDAAIKLARLKPSSGRDWIKCGLLKAPTIKSIGFNASQIIATANALGITIRAGSTHTRTIVINSIQNSSYPSGAATNLIGVVDYLNNQFAINNFPMTAFNSDDGELLLQLNISVASSYIQINNVTNSAASAMGLSSFVSTQVFGDSDDRLVVDGVVYEELSTLSSGQITLGSPSSTLSISNNFDLKDYELIHIYNHPTQASNGTYQVTSSNPLGSNIIINGTIAAGTFNYIIYGDSIGLDNQAQKDLNFAYISSTARLTKKNVLSVSSPAIGGVNFADITRGAPGGTYTFSVSLTDGVYSFALSDGTNTGVSSFVNSGYLGYVNVAFPDGESYVKLLIDGAISGASESVSVVDLSIEKDYVLSGSFYEINGLSELAVDKRRIGTVGLDIIGSDYTEEVVEPLLANTRDSGIISGIDISISGGDVLLSGGKAIVNGKVVSKAPYTIDVDQYAGGADQLNIALQDTGEYVVFSETNDALKIADLIVDNRFAIIAQVTTDGTDATSFVDGRLFLNNLDSRVPVTVDTRSNGAGTFKSVDSALLYTSNKVGNINPDVSVLSDVSLTSDFTFTAGNQVEIFGSLTTTQDIIIEAGTSIEMDGYLQVDGSLTMGAYSSLKLKGGFRVSSFELSEGSVLQVFADGYTDSININGSNIAIVGSPERPAIYEITTGNTLYTATNGAGLFISNLKFYMSTSASNVLQVDSTYDRVVFDQCEFYRTTPFVPGAFGVEPNGAAIAVDSGSVTEMVIKHCVFKDHSLALYVSEASGSASKIVFEGNVLEDMNYGVRIFNTTEAVFKNNLFASMHTGFLDLGSGLNPSEKIIISENIIRDRFSDAIPSNPLVVKIEGSNSFIMTNNIIENIESSISSIIINNCKSGVIEGNIVRGLTLNNDSFILASTQQEGQKISIVGNDVSMNSGIFVSGKYLNILSNHVNVTSSSGLNVVDLTDRCIFDGNEVVAPTGIFTAYGSTISNNIIKAQDYLFTSNSSVANKIENIIVEGNNLIATNGNIEVSIQSQNNIFGSSIKGNVMSVSGATPSLLIKYPCKGLIIEGNTINHYSGTPDSIVKLSDIDDTSSGNYISLIGNTINGNASRIVDVNMSGILMKDNTLAGSASVAAVDITNGASNCIVEGNLLLSSGVGGTEITYGGAPDFPQNTIIVNNKNAISTSVSHAYEGYKVGAWTLDGNGILTNSNTSGDALYITIDDIPFGSELVSIDLHMRSTGAAGTVNAQIFEQTDMNISSFTNSSVSAITGNTLAVSEEVITITPSSTYYIKNTEALSLRVTMSTSNNKFGQVVAKYRY